MKNIIYPFYINNLHFTHTAVECGRNNDKIIKSSVD